MSEAPFVPRADAEWGRPSEAWHLQPGFTPEGQAALGRLQAQALALWPGALNAAPVAALHVTIHALVPVRPVFDKAAYWEEIEPEARAIARSARPAAPFALRFTRIRVMPDSIIALAEDPSGIVASLRRAVLARLPPPPGLAHPRYDIIHTTLARFAAPEPVPAAAVARLEGQSLAERAPVHRIRIVREHRYPCLTATEVESVRLAGVSREE